MNYKSAALKNPLSSHTAESAGHLQSTGESIPMAISAKFAI